MSEPTKMELAGIFRPREQGPGFGIPVFSGDECYWVQRIGDDGNADCAGSDQRKILIYHCKSAKWARFESLGAAFSC